MSIEFLLQGVLPSNIRAIQTNRLPVDGLNGRNRPPWAAFNLGDHVQDSSEHVAHNRRELLSRMPGCEQLHWLEQIHSTQVHQVEESVVHVKADASVTATPQQACVVMTADCLPILLWANNGSEVAAVHAGWRGLLNGVIESTLSSMSLKAEELSVWLGPCIGPQAFEVGEEVRQGFIAHDQSAEAAFAPSGEQGKWLANLQLLAQQRLTQLGSKAIYQDPRCTYSDAELFYSYRRDGLTGRMASAIWITSWLKYR